jgi:hypothetical protein
MPARPGTWQGRGARLLGKPTQHRYKQRCWPGLPRRGVIHGDRCPRPIHEHLFPVLVFLAQHYIQVPSPVLIALAKPTVAIPLGMRLPVFFPHQLQGQMAMLLRLLMNAFPIGLRSRSHRSRRHGLVSKQLGFQFLFAQTLGQRPTDPRCRRSRYWCTVPSPIPQLRAI